MSEPAIDEESKRVSLQVTSLSTQLIESIEKQSRLEEQLHHQKKENEQLKKESDKLIALQTSYNDTKAENEALGDLNRTLGKKLEDETKEKLAAKDEVSKLQSEVEELSASLFDEANKMVSTARREAHDIGKRNESLISQLKEKDLLLENLQTQLRELKNVIYNKDDVRSIVDHSNRYSIDELKVNSTNPEEILSPQQIIYSPTINAIRFDLKLFNEFNRFIADLKYIEQIKDTNTKFLKKLVADEVEPTLRIDLANGIGWLSKRSLMGAFIDGRVIIEPVSGINETYRINFQNSKTQEADIKSNLYSYPAHSPPVAINQPCALCGEDRNDILEHSRLYILKVHALKAREDSPSASSISVSSPSPSTPIIAHQYPLCSYCLFRVRSACDLFAFLRSLKTNIWKLENDISIRKAWLELSRLRSKLFWSKVGIWDLESNISETKIYPGTDDIVYKTLESFEQPRPSNTLSRQNSILNDSFGLKEPKTPSLPSTANNNYENSPLVNEIGHSPKLIDNISLKDTTDTEPPNSIQPIPEVVQTSPTQVQKKTDQEHDTTIQLSEEPEPEPEPEPEVEDNDITNDILNDYSQSEDEDESPMRPVIKPQGLMIQTERPQDDLLISEENTPVVNQINKFGEETPTKESGFDFENVINKEDDTDDDEGFVDA